MLASNLLSGKIPESISQLSSLVVLNLDENEITGRIPTSITDLSMLETLSLSLNSIRGGLLADGELARLKNLRNLFVHSNQLTGSLPSGTWTLKNLENIDLRNNALDGTLSTSIGLLKNLSSLIINKNMHTGTIPSELGLLGESLTTLNLSENHFQGTLPPELVQLSNIATPYEFRIFNGNLTGPVAPQICQRVDAVEFCNSTEIDCSCCIAPSNHNGCKR